MINKRKNDCLIDNNILEYYTALNVGNVIKLGKQTLIVRELFSIDTENNSKKEDLKPKISLANNLKYEISQELQCRFCLNKDLEDQLLSVCDCKGTLKYVHFVCLSKWLKTKEKMVYVQTNETNKVYCVCYEKFYCEICKKIFPCKF